ncbi:TonB-dependent receptor [Dyella caseinilytica]|uniref:TonB-dependent receptor n=1 Tax=Dyella caseinilytica TaxID=1849581 RepID=A0ABX7GTU9_9GAMM|nr:TonB-dependent receptor [Dyella caseinilytica]QRN53446.1 TonB-dependent receptor [Dyella caseinilytica]GFZ86568.1 TonB-dependent receptor [Dyella caseinilytica]
MSHRKTLLAASIFAGLCLSGTLHAQDTTQAPTTNPANQTTEQQAEKANAKQLSTVTVVGIRASLQKSMDTKRNADAIVDAITATDIGKFPATNVAEALAQVPGVTLDHLFGATQRVSIDGIDPSLNLAFLDGHPVAQAMWLYGDSPNRGFNYSLLPPEILGQLEIYKSPEARLTEGSLGGTVLMHTVQPLDVASGTLSGSFGMNYNDMVGNQRPNGSVFYSWHNSDKTFGVDVSAQHYEENTSREGQEIFGYSTVGSVEAANPAVAAEVANGTIKPSNVFPNELNSADFQQTEKRNSVLVNVQWRPNEHFDSTLSLMYMTDSLNNINTSLYPIQSAGPITSLGPANGNGVITSGTVGAPAGSTAPAESFEDNDARGSYIRTKGADWRGTYYGEGWRLSGQTGVSVSDDTISQAFEEFEYQGPFSWNTSRGFNFTDLAAANDPANWIGTSSNIGYKPYKAKDQYNQLDFSKDFDGFVNELLVGARYASHWESQSLLVLSNEYDPDLTEVGYGGLSNLSGQKSIGLGGSTVSHVVTPGYQSIFNAVLNPNNPLLADNPFDTYNNTFNVQQKNSAFYVQANFGTDDVHGNLGVRYVHTETDAYGYNVPQSCSDTSYNCVFPAGYGYVGETHTNNNWLPAFNIAWNVTPDVILRGAASETVAYAPYNELAPFFESNDTIAPLTATAGNPSLKPYKSINFDISAEYYFNPESVVAVSGFYKNVLNYVVNTATEETVQNGSWGTIGTQTLGQELVAAGVCTTAGLCQYSVSAPINGGRATVKGAAISYQEAFGDSGFGLRANYTYSDSRTAHPVDDASWLPYNSKNSYTLAPYFEKGPYSASISYNYRSEYLAGGYVAGAAPSYTGSYKELDASVGYQFNKNFSVSFNMLNLLNSVYKQYLGQNEAEILNEYVSGREFMLEAHFKF